MQRILLSQLTTDFEASRQKIKAPPVGASEDDKEWIVSVLRRIDKFFKEPYRIGETPLERINQFIKTLSETETGILGSLTSARKGVADDAIRENLLEVLAEIKAECEEIAKRYNLVTIKDLAKKPLPECVKVLVNPFFTNATDKKEMAELLFAKAKPFQRDFRHELTADPESLIKLFLDGDDVIRRAMIRSEILKSTTIKDKKQELDNIVAIFNYQQQLNLTGDHPGNIAVKVIEEIRKKGLMTVFLENPGFLKQCLADHPKAWEALKADTKDRPAIKKAVQKKDGLLFVDIKPEAWFSILSWNIGLNREVSSYFLSQMDNFRIFMLRNPADTLQHILRLSADSNGPVEILMQLMMDKRFIPFLQQISLEADLLFKAPLLMSAIKDDPTSIIARGLFEGRKQSDFEKAVLHHMENIGVTKYDKDYHQNFIKQLKNFLPDAHPLRQLIDVIYARPELGYVMTTWFPNAIKNFKNPAFHQGKQGNKEYESDLNFWDISFNRMQNLPQILKQLKGSIPVANYTAIEKALHSQLKLADTVDLLSYFDARKQEMDNTGFKLPAKEYPAVNILEYPEKKYPLPAGGNLTIGDLHGNCLKLIHALVLHDMIKLNKNEYERLVEIIRKPAMILTSEDIALFDKIINSITANNEYHLHLIGDILADRSGNDYLTLKLVERLIKIGLDVKINMSNHDHIFIENLERLGDENLETKISSKSMDSSLKQLHNLIQRGVVKLDEVKKLYNEVYAPKISLITYDLGDERPPKLIIRTHAFVANDVKTFVHALNGVAKELGLKLLAPNNITHMAITTKIDEINIAFRAILSDPKKRAKFFESFPEGPDEVKTPERREANWIFAVFWNRAYDKLESEEIKSKIDFSIEFEHGHDDSYKKKFDSVRCTDNTFGKEPEMVSAALDETGYLARDRQGKMIEYPKLPVAAVAANPPPRPATPPPSDLPRGSPPKPSIQPGDSPPKGSQAKEGFFGQHRGTRAAVVEEKEKKETPDGSEGPHQ